MPGADTQMPTKPLLASMQRSKLRSAPSPVRGSICSQLPKITSG